MNTGPVTSRPILHGVAKKGIAAHHMFLQPGKLKLGKAAEDGLEKGNIEA
jgi:hypothetical protein